MRHCPNPECPDARAGSRAGEYREETEVCAACGTPLVPGPAPRPVSAAAGSCVRLTAIAAYPSRHEAELARGFLEALGIPARVAADDAGAAYPQLGLLTGGVQLEVPAERAEEARALLEDAEGGR